MIGLGAEHFKGVIAQDVASVIRKAIDSGINYIDCICGEPEIRDKLRFRACARVPRPRDDLWTLWRCGTATAAVRTEQLDALMFPVNPAFDTLSLASLDGPQWHDQRP